MLMFRQVLLMGHVAAPSTGPGVSNLRLNSLDPSWFGACPPKTVSAAACRNGREVLGLPLTGIRLSWEAIAGATTPRGTAQVKFEAQITHLRSGQVVWTSGAVSSAEPFTVAEPHPPLLPETSYSAQVRVWLATPAEAGVAAAPPTADPTAWSLPALFDTRPDARSWSGSEWIGGHNQLRGELTLPAGAVVERARLYAIGLGAFVVSLNGQPVGDHVMDPPQTAYPSRTLYAAFNVTCLLKPGVNGIGALIGRYKYGYMDVWCNLTDAQHHPNACRSFRLRLVAELAGGATVTAVTNVSSWVGRQSEIVYDHEYHGEILNASRRLAGWDLAPMASFSAGTWHPARAVPPRGVPDSALRPAQLPPVRVVETRKASSITKTTKSGSPTTYIFDFGERCLFRT
jgi:alpha-L-rhamnosidase